MARARAAASDEYLRRHTANVDPEDRASGRCAPLALPDRALPADYLYRRPDAGIAPESNGKPHGLNEDYGLDRLNITNLTSPALRSLEQGDTVRAKAQIKLLRKLLDVQKEVSDALLDTASHKGRNLDIRV